MAEHHSFSSIFVGQRTKSHATNKRTEKDQRGSDGSVECFVTNQVKLQEART